MKKRRGQYSSSLRTDFRRLRSLDGANSRIINSLKTSLQNIDRVATRSQTSGNVQGPENIAEDCNSSSVSEQDNPVDSDVESSTHPDNNEAGMQVPLCNPISSDGEGSNDSEEEVGRDSFSGSSQEEVELISEDEEDDSSTSTDFSDGGEFYTDDEHEEPDVFEPNYSKHNIPIYPGCKLTLLDSCVMILSFIIRFKLPLAAVKGLLSLIKFHLPANSTLASSLYHLRKILLFDKYKPIKNFYCSGCNRNLFENERCFRSKCRGKKTNAFFTFDIESQLKVLFARESFRNALMHRFNRQKIVDQNYEDIYDGELYQNFANFFLDPYNFSMMFYSDGVKIYKSSKSNIWPFFLIINELPFRLRFLPQNVLFGGLWFGESKPNFNTFLRPLVTVFERFKNGINVVCEQSLIKVKGMLLSGIGDMPARSLMYNMTNFNGAYGCMKCLIKGKSVQIPGKSIRSRVWVYPYRSNIRQRDSLLSIRYGEQAGKRPVYGFKGPTLFSTLVPDFINAMGIDSMHAIFAGVVKRIIELLTSCEYRNEAFSIYKFLSKLEERLAALKPPHFVTRPPRSIKSCFSIFKTSEFKNFFFYYSVPLFMGILPDNYLKHFITLIEAAYLLHSDSVSDEDIDEARRLLKVFVRDFEMLYGARFMSANLHSLLHLPDAVKKSGPLWVSSCFPLEDLNGKVARLVHATKNPEHQICESFFMQQKLALFTSKVEKNSIPKAYALSLKRNKCNNNEEIAPGTFSVGAYTIITDPNSLLIEAYVDHDLSACRLYVFFKLFKDDLLYVANCYSRAIRNISFYALFEGKNGGPRFIGIIECFVKLVKCTCGLRSNTCNCNIQFHAIVRKTQPVVNDLLLDTSFIAEIAITDEIIAVDVKHIVTMCYTSLIDDRFFCAKLVNCLEME